jgi:hypothetical protein
MDPFDKFYYKEPINEEPINEEHDDYELSYKYNDEFDTLSNKMKKTLTFSKRNSDISETHYKRHKSVKKTVSFCLKLIKSTLESRINEVCSESSKRVFNLLTSRSIDILPHYNSNDLNFMYNIGTKSLIHNIYHISLHIDKVEAHSFVIEVKSNEYKVYQSFVNKYSLYEWFFGFSKNHTCRDDQSLYKKDQFNKAYKKYGGVDYFNTANPDTFMKQLNDYLISCKNNILDDKNKLSNELFGVSQWTTDEFERIANEHTMYLHNNDVPTKVSLTYVSSLYNCNNS